MGKVTYSLRLPNEEYDVIIQLAQREHLTIREWLRRAIDEKLKRGISLTSHSSNKP